MTKGCCRGGRPFVVLLALLFGSCQPPEARAPNILLIVVDTLRFDHLSFYGYSRDTSPQMQRLLADRGVVVESAYAQAPWTLPSVASMLTGVAPERMLDDQGLPWGIPETATTLAEVASEKGFRTAAFIANPTLHRDNGFAQGFAEFWTAPYELASMARHADDVTERVLPWLEDAGEDPFFLYVHYLDPHDPYDNADLVDGRSPFMPEYSGRLRGGDVHGLYLGALEMEDPAADVAHLTALYDSEIAFVDRHVGRLLEHLTPSQQANTLIVLTSDHGEELFDHGGWKHGETLYEEMIHVPLVFRWDGHLPAKQRAVGTVRLLDLWPTILARAGWGEAEERNRQGKDLWPLLSGLPFAETPAFSSHLSTGPMRVAGVVGGKKEILFDRHALFEPRDEREKMLWRRDVARLQRRERYYLQADAQEQQNVAGLADESSNADVDPSLLWPAIDAQLGPGLRLVARLPVGSKLEGHLTLGEPPATIRTMLSSNEDHHRVEGSRVELSWLGDGIPKGLWLGGALRSVVDIELKLDGEPVAPSLSPSAAANASWPRALRTLRLSRTPEWPEGKPTIHLWVRDDDRPFGRGERDEETLKRLKALGYAD